MNAHHGPDPNCLNDEQLQVLLNDDSETPSSYFNVRWISHLNDCHSCAQRLERISGWPVRLPNPHKLHAESGPNQLTHFDSNTPVEDVAGYQKKLEFLKQLVPPKDSNLEQSQPSPEQVLGQFLILEEVGQGGMGTVYRALDQKLNRIVALKQLHNSLNTDQSRLLEREATIGAQVEHPNVISVYDVIQVNDKTLLVMQYVDGYSLAVKIKSSQHCNPREMANIVAQVAEGLAVAHQKSILHRDVKPANILIDEQNGIAQIGDFGLATPSFLSDYHRSGTPAYMSPEQERGSELSEKSDIYSLGISLYQALSGLLPDGNELRPEGIAPDLFAICQKACQRNPANRYDSMIQFSQDLRRWLRGEPILAKPESSWQTLKRTLKANRRVLAVSICLLMAVGVFLIITDGLQEKIGDLKSKNQQQEQALNHSRQKQVASEKELQNKETQVQLERGRSIMAALEAVNRFRTAPQSRQPDQLALGSQFAGMIFTAIIESQLIQFEKVRNEGASFDQIQNENPTLQINALVPLSNRACMHWMEQGKLDKALALVERTLRFVQFAGPEFQAKYPIQVATLKRIGASIYTRFGRVEIAIQEIREAQKLLNEAPSFPGHENERLATQICLAEYYSYTRQFKKSARILDRIRPAILRFQSPLNQKNVACQVMKIKLGVAYAAARQPQQSQPILVAATKLLFADPTHQKNLGCLATLANQWKYAATRLADLKFLDLTQLATETQVELLTQIQSVNRDLARNSLARAQERQRIMNGPIGTGPTRIQQSQAPQANHRPTHSTRRRIHPRALRPGQNNRTRSRNSDDAID